MHQRAVPNTNFTLVTITMTEREKERYDTIRQLIAKNMVATDGAKKLRLSVRQIQRLKKAVKQSGIHGVVHKNRGRRSNRHIDPVLDKRTRSILKKTYRDFGPTLAKEKLEENEKIALSVSCIRNRMIAEQLWTVKPRRSSQDYRTWRPRKDAEGEMIQFDGSYHRWFEERREECCLLAAIDDATGKLEKLQFAQNESVRSVFTFWKEYVSRQGKPLLIYLDKYSTYKINHPSAVDNEMLVTQFQRAVRSLDIRLISAHSPQAKGRVERLFGTLQDRLVKELRLQKISTMEEANTFLDTTFIPAFNAKFAVVPKRAGNLHRSLSPNERANLPRIFAIHSERKVQNDFTIRFKNQWIQLAEIQPTTVYKNDVVSVEERLDGSMYLRLNENDLDYTILPERPQKAHTVQPIPLPALTRMKSPWKPPVNHPWRKRIHADVAKRVQSMRAQSVTKMPM